MGEDSLKGRMELSHEDQWVWLGTVPGELVLRILVCAFHQEIAPKERRRRCLVKALKKKGAKEA